jgi:hypothetical protein
VFAASWPQREHGVPVVDPAPQGGLHKVQRDRHPPHAHRACPAVGMMLNRSMWPIGRFSRPSIWRNSSAGVFEDALLAVEPVRSVGTAPRYHWHPAGCRRQWHDQAAAYPRRSTRKAILQFTL